MSLIRNADIQICFMHTFLHYKKNCMLVCWWWWEVTFWHYGHVNRSFYWSFAWLIAPGICSIIIVASSMYACRLLLCRVHADPEKARWVMGRWVMGRYGQYVQWTQKLSICRKLGYHYHINLSHFFAPVVKAWNQLLIGLDSIRLSIMQKKLESYPYSPFTTSIILCFNKHRLTQVHLENGR